MVRAVLGITVHLAFLGRALHGGIVGMQGMVQLWDPPPPTVEVHKLERNRVVILFEEQTRVLPVDVATDITNPGLYETVYPMDPGIVPAGTPVTSYYFHADPRGRVSGTLVRYTGSVTFDAPVLGILVKPPTMHPTDHLLGAPGVRYPREVDIRQGVLGPGDYVRLTANRRTVRFDLRAGLWSDDFRVLIQADMGQDPPGDCHGMGFLEEAFPVNSCPEPASALCLLTGGVFWITRRLRHRVLFCLSPPLAPRC